MVFIFFGAPRLFVRRRFSREYFLWKTFPKSTVVIWNFSVDGHSD